MKLRHLILMLLKVSSGSVESKTKLQKVIYFISMLLNRDFGFKAHYYGPYSTIVEQSLDELIGAGFVNERREVFGIDINRGFEAKRYEYKLTVDGGKLADILAEENGEAYNTIAKFIGNLYEIGNPDYLNLSISAKAYFILNKEGKLLTKEQIIEKANGFGWNVNQKDINIAIDILKKLSLVT